MPHDTDGPIVNTDLIRTMAIVWRANGAEASADTIEALCSEVDRLRDVVKAADEVWRCKRCGGGGLIAPGNCCQTCAGDGVRVVWADDGSDLYPLIDSLAALDTDWDA